MTLCELSARLLTCAAVVVGALGCEPNETGSSGSLVAQDSRYRIVLTTQATPGTRNGELRLQMFPKSVWHIAPEAPAKLKLDPPPGIRFDVAELRSADAVSLDDSEIEFATGYRVEPGAESGTVSAIAHGQVKFGVCLENSEGCEIVRRDVDLHLALP